MSDLKKKASDSKISLRNDQIDKFITMKRRQYNDYHYYEEDVNNFTDLTELDLTRELDVDELLTNLHNLFLLDEEYIYADKYKLKHYIVNVRKITCRDLDKMNSKLLQNNVDRYIMQIIYRYTYVIEFDDIDNILIVYFINFSMRVYGR